MKILQQRIRYLWGLLLLVVALPVLGAILPRRWHSSPQQSCVYQVCVARFGYHSQIVVPVQTPIYDWRNYLNLYNSDNASTDDYLSFGWGERTWYVNPPTHPRQKFSGALRALLCPNASALRVQKYANFPHYDEIKCVGVSPENYLNLMNFIQNSFQRNSQGEKIKFASNVESQSIFYEAKGTYSLLNNSNHWTTKGLETAEINTPIWASHAITITLHLVDTC
jgi:uncharacterized protein (TIGR02117 family)